MMKIQYFFVLGLICLAAACGNDSDVVKPVGLDKIRNVASALETSNLPDTDDSADMDDPAFWIHASVPEKSLIITAVKDGGLRVYNIRGETLQIIQTDLQDEGKSRYNGVDVAYGFDIDGTKTDIAVATDRGQDLIKVWRIDGDSFHPLTDISSEKTPRCFPTNPDRTYYTDPSKDTENDWKEQHTCYGMSVYKKDGKHYAIVTQRNESRIAEFLLKTESDGKVTALMSHDWRFPYSWNGQDLTSESDENPDLDWSPQFEGLTVDKQQNVLYAGQEDTGIWRINLNTGKADDAPFYETRGSVISPFNNRDSFAARDIEGLCIYYGKNGNGYILASSQGSAHGDDASPDTGYDDTFLIFNRKYPNELLGRFQIPESGAVDAVQECDGMEITGINVPDFPKGIIAVQDGYDNDLNNLDGETDSSNLKLVSTETLSKVFPEFSFVWDYDPRK